MRRSPPAFRPSRTLTYTYLAAATLFASVTFSDDWHAVINDVDGAERCERHSHRHDPHRDADDSEGADAPACLARDEIVPDGTLDPRPRVYGRRRERTRSKGSHPRIAAATIAGQAAISINSSVTAMRCYVLKASGQDQDPSSRGGPNQQAAVRTLGASVGAIEASRVKQARSQSTRRCRHPCVGGLCDGVYALFVCDAVMAIGTGRGESTASRNWTNQPVSSTWRAVRRAGCQRVPAMISHAHHVAPGAAHEHACDSPDHDADQHVPQHGPRESGDCPAENTRGAPRTRAAKTGGHGAR